MSSSFKMIKLFASFIIFALVCITTAASIDETQSCDPDPCKNGGICFKTNDIKAAKNFMCKCDPGFCGEFCESSKCDKSPSDVVIVLRVILLGLTAFLGSFAIFMFVYRCHTVSREQEIPAQQIAGTKFVSTHVTNFKGKKSFVDRSQSATSKSLCSRVFKQFEPKHHQSSAAASPNKEHGQAQPKPNNEPGQVPPPKMNKEFEKKLDEWRKRNAAASAVSEPKKKRSPAWDEIEMRRHGLVNRYCDRVCFPDCPSNPSTVDVSIYNPSGASIQPSVSQASINLQQSPDPSSVYSAFTTPLATSTPRSKNSTVLVENETQPSSTPLTISRAAPSSQSSLHSAIASSVPASSQPAPLVHDGPSIPTAAAFSSHGAAKDSVYMMEPQVNASSLDSFQAPPPGVASVTPVLNQAPLEVPPVAQVQSEATPQHANGPSTQVVSSSNGATQDSVYMEPKLHDESAKIVHEQEKH